MKQSLKRKGDKMRFEAQYRLLGSEESLIVCDFCKKRTVERYWAVENVTTGEIIRCGSTCISKALKIPKAEFRGAIKDHNAKIEDGYKTLRALADQIAWDRVDVVCGNDPELQIGAKRLAAIRADAIHARYYRLSTRLLERMNRHLIPNI
jgi:hypothetical protein